MVGNIENMMGPKALGGIAGPGAKSGATVGSEFATFVKDATREAVDTMHTGEKLSMKGVSGEADLNEVVAAVNSADITLRTIVALRDRMVQAYQEIIRMPV